MIAKDIVTVLILSNVLRLILLILYTVDMQKVFEAIWLLIPFILQQTIGTSLVILLLYFVGIWDEVKRGLSMMLALITILLIVYILVRFAFYLTF